MAKNLGEAVSSVVFFMIFSGVGIALFASWPWYSAKCFDFDSIIDVGGCDDDGLCKVKTESGEFLRVEYPVRGERICLAETRKYMGGHFTSTKKLYEGK